MRIRVHGRDAAVKFDRWVPIHGARAVLVTACAHDPRSPLLMLDNLLSKVVAAGLAAGVFLLWWPAHLPSTGVQWLVLRGLAWTLAFEVLALSFFPLERMATGAITRRRSAGRARRMRSRLAAASAPARASGAVVLAFTGLLLPGVMLLHTGGRPPARPAAQTTKEVREVVVRKVVREKTVFVRVAAPSAPAPAPMPTSTPAATKPAATTQARAEPKQQPSTKVAAEQTTTAPATTPATTPTTAADPAALPNPAEPGAPADVTAGG